MKYYLDTNFLDSYQETLDRINQSYQRIFEPITEAMHINQELFNRLNSSVEEATRMFSQSIGALYEGLSASYVEQLQSMSVLSPTYAEAINNFSSIAAPLAEAFHSIDFDSLLASIQSEDGIEYSDDYVITDSYVIREIDFPDNIVIPMGYNRLRIRTDIFIALISVLISVFASLFQNIGTKDPQENARLLLEQNQLIQEQTLLDEEQNQLLQEQNQLTKEKSRLLLEQEKLTREQNQLLWEQNQILLEILESVDTSESSQADFIKDMRESLQEQASLFQMSLESAVAAPESAFAVQESGDPTQEATDSIQKADDPTQPTNDTSHSVPSTGYDNE